MLDRKAGKWQGDLTVNSMIKTGIGSGCCPSQLHHLFLSGSFGNGATSGATRHNFVCSSVFGYLCVYFTV